MTLCVYVIPPFIGKVIIVDPNTGDISQAFTAMEVQVLANQITKDFLCAHGPGRRH